MWHAMNLGSLILGVLFGMGAHKPSYLGAYLGFVIQWSLIGLLVSVILSARKNARLTSNE